MKRREFMTQTLFAAVGVGVSVSFGGFTRASPFEKAPSEDQHKPAIARALLLGDSISMGVGSSGDYQGYEVPVQNLLTGIATVSGISGNGGNTRFGLQNLSAWLGKNPWDVIHFNWGLHDIVRQADGACIVPAAEYESNLRKIVTGLKLTKAKLIWATTTPVPKEEANKAANRRNSDVIAYNSIARRIMEDHQIPIDDLYSFALPRLDEIQQPQDVHFTFQGSAVLAKPVADSILTALRSRM